MDNCPVKITSDIISGKWKPIIILKLEHKKYNFNALQQELYGITPRSLSLALKALENDSIITRKVLGETTPIKVEYALSSIGESLYPIVKKCISGEKNTIRKKKTNCKILQLIFFCFNYFIFSVISTIESIIFEIYAIVACNGSSVDKSTSTIIASSIGVFVPPAFKTSFHCSSVISPLRNF